MLKIEKAQFSFFLLWFPIVSICIYIGILLSGPLGHYLYTHNGKPEYAASNDGFSEWVIALIFLVGLFMGVGQWFAINTKIKKTHYWVLATLIGFSLGSFIFFKIFVFVLQIILVDISKYYEVYLWVENTGILIGTFTFTGICQWVSLKRKITDSFKWSAVMAMSFVIGAILAYLVSYLVSPFSREVFFIVFSISVGLISGVFAEQLIIRPEINRTNE